MCTAADGQRCQCPLGLTPDPGRPGLLHTPPAAAGRAPFGTRAGLTPDASTAQTPPLSHLPTPEPDGKKGRNSLGLIITEKLMVENLKSNLVIFRMTCYSQH